MRNLCLLITATLLFFTQLGYSQVNCNPNCNLNNSINLTTGLDNSGNLFTTYTNIDANWKLLNVPPIQPACTPPAPVIPTNAYNYSWANTAPAPGIGNWWVNQAGASTLVPAALGTNFGIGTRDGFDCNNWNGQPYVFQRSFCLCEDDTINLNLSFKGDDQLRLELWDLQTPSSIAASNLYVYPGSASTPVNWNISQFLPSGNYAIRAYLVNVSSATLGFSVLGNLTSQNSVLMDESSSCCQNYSLTIQKIFDANCNGVYDTNDEPGDAGWTYDILQGGTVIRTVTTNSFGEVILSGLAPGTYTIRENPNSTYPNSTPFQNNQTITIDNSNPHAFINFFNCINKLEIRKLLDNDCDGVKGQSESYDNNWSFEVYQGSTLVGTYTTGTTAAGQGRVSIWGLPTGNYQIVELPNSGSSYNIPLNNPQNITLNQYTPQVIIFSNCRRQLVVRKILDNNCDGILDPTDVIGGSGWDFEIYDGISGSLVSSGTTNSSGKVYFPGLSIGQPYTIKELFNTGSTFQQPFQNPISITFLPTLNNAVQQVDFYNCIPLEKLCCPEEKQLNLKLESIAGPHNKNPGEGWANNEPLSFVESKIDISLPPSYANIPITEMRLSVVDMSFEDNIEACGDCIDNPANWASLSYVNLPGTDTAKPIGAAATGQLDAKTIINDGSNLPPATWYTFNKNYNTKELVWDNPNGVLLSGGEEVLFQTFLPPFSEIPCCSKSVKICYKVTYIFADCTQCDTILCTTGYELAKVPIEKKN